MNSPVLYLDCTATVRSGLNTGIQRVVKSIVERKNLFEKYLGVTCRPICHQFDWYHDLDDALVMTIDNFASFPKVEPQYGDIYFCIDAYWTYETNKWFPFFKDRGCRMASLIYDLIPMECPDFFDEASVESFRQTTNEVMKLSDIILTISQHSKSVIEQYLVGFDNKLLVNHFRLSPLNANLLNQTQFQEVPQFSYKDYFLMVGTIEQRKGYWQTLEEFEYLWRDGDRYPLCIIGKPGNNSDVIIKKIHELQNYGYPLEWRFNVTDGELGWLYNNAKSVICASYSEGYGLPLAEALLFNKPVLANRLPVFGEFAGVYPIYFDINKKRDLVSKIKDFDTFTWFDEHIVFPTWDETIYEICQLLKRALPRR